MTQIKKKIVTWKGMSISTTYNANRILLPGNLYRAKLHAALIPISITKMSAITAAFGPVTTTWFIRRKGMRDDVGGT